MELSTEFEKIYIEKMIKIERISILQKEGRKFMSDKMFENNQVSLVGEIVSELTFSHEVYGEGFYTMEICSRKTTPTQRRTSSNKPTNSARKMLPK